MQAPHRHIANDGFRLRGLEVSRIDAFSDVVFGFALTLIVVSLEVPRTYAQFHQLVLGFAPFFICFVFLFMVWHAHYRFFRRYGLQDTSTILINAALLFTVLLYVYPLKFLWIVSAQQLMPHAYAPAAEAGRKLVPIFTSDLQIREMMTVYGAGFAATYFAFTALYWNAWRQRQALRLNALEVTLTLSDIWNFFGVGCVGLLCILTAFLLPPARAGAAGWVFLLIAVYRTMHGFMAGARARTVRARCTEDELLSSVH